MTLEYAITAIVCLITAVVIQRIYKKERLGAVGPNGVKGILWFGWAIFIWGLGASINLLSVSLLSWSSDYKVLVYSGVFVSLLNSMFILLSLPSIEHNGRPNMVVRFVSRFSEKEFISIYSVMMAMLIFVFFTASYTNAAISSSLIWLIDIPISIVVAFALLHSLNRAFSNRKMRFMYLPSFVLFLLIVTAVTHRIVPADQVPFFMTADTWKLIGVVTAISFKFLFILLFSILLYSWKFLSEKEEKQSRLEAVVSEKKQLEKNQERLLLANESHLSTISRLKKELKMLTEASKIELSDRQKEVLGNLAILGDEKSYTEIAEAMHISVDGFQAHIHQIKKVLKISGTAGKSQLIQYAQKNNLVQYATLKP